MNRFSFLENSCSNLAKLMENADENLNKNLDVTIENLKESVKYITEYILNKHNIEKSGSLEENIKNVRPYLDEYQGIGNVFNEIIEYKSSCNCSECEEVSIGEIFLDKMAMVCMWFVIENKLIDYKNYDLNKLALQDKEHFKQLVSKIED